MRKWNVSPFFSAKDVVKFGVKIWWNFPRYVFQGLGVWRKISPKFHVKNGVKNGKFHANFTLPGRSAFNILSLGGQNRQSPIASVQRTQSALAGHSLRVPNGAFQTVFFRFLTSACDRGKPLQRHEECLKTPVFLSILVPSALGDPDHPLNARLWKTPFRKHRLLLLGIPQFHVERMLRERTSIAWSESQHNERRVYDD